jgi:hypothetical protein
MKDKIDYSKTQHTLDSWTGGGYYKIVWEFELFGLKLVLWRKF